MLNSITYEIMLFILILMRTVYYCQFACVHIIIYIYLYTLQYPYYITLQPTAAHLHSYDGKILSKYHTIFKSNYNYYHKIITLSLFVATILNLYILLLSLSQCCSSINSIVIRWQRLLTSYMKRYQKNRGICSKYLMWHDMTLLRIAYDNCTFTIR